MENFRNDLTACRGDMLKRFYLKKYHAADRKRRDRLKRIQTLSEAQQYIAEIRAKLSRSFGTLPQALPNDVQRTGRLATKKLLIDKVLYQSRPGYFISALFYRPAICSGKGMKSCIIDTCPPVGNIPVTAANKTARSARKKYGILNAA